MIMAMMMMMMICGDAHIHIRIVVFISAVLFVHLLAFFGLWILLTLCKFIVYCFSRSSIITHF